MSVVAGIEEKKWSRERFNRTREEEKRFTASGLNLKPRAAEGFYAAVGQKAESALLPKKNRIARKVEIKRILDKRQKQKHTSLLRAIIANTDQAFPRILVITSKKLGGAVQRNRIRRVLYGAFDKIKHSINKNIDIVLFPRPMDLKDKAVKERLRKEFASLVVDEKAVVDFG